MIEHLLSRPCSDAINLTNNKTHLSKRLQDYKLVLVMGPMCSGKSYTLNSYVSPPNWDATFWQREKILKMLSRNHNLDNKIFSYFKRIEDNILPEMFLRERNQVFVEGWFTRKSDRKRILSYTQHCKTCVIVFDGPIDLLIGRAQHLDKLDLTKFEYEDTIKRQYAVTNWPDFSEGWNDIFYATTFGGAGEDYLMKTCYLKG